MLETEGRKLEAALMGLRIAHAAFTADTEGVELPTLAIIHTGDTLGFAVYILDAERRFIGTACVVFDITGQTGVIDALAVFTLALRVVITGHTLIAILTGNTDPKVALATSVATDLAGLAGA